MKIASACALFALGLVLVGCAHPKRLPIMASVAQNVVTSDGFVDNDVKPTKTGEASTQGVLFVCTGDDSIGAAMKQGGITKVHSIDYKMSNILGIVSSSTTIVRGE